MHRSTNYSTNHLFSNYLCFNYLSFNYRCSNYLCFVSSSFTSFVSPCSPCLFSYSSRLFTFYVSGCFLQASPVKRNNNLVTSNENSSRIPHSVLVEFLLVQFWNLWLNLDQSRGGFSTRHGVDKIVWLAINAKFSILQWSVIIYHFPQLLVFSSLAVIPIRFGFHSQESSPGISDIHGYSVGLFELDDFLFHLEAIEWILSFFLNWKVPGNLI